MLSQKQIKLINSLKIKKFRLEHKAFLVEGEKGVNELLNSTLTPFSIFATQAWLDRNFDTLKAARFEIHEITESELRKISDLVTPNQVLAIAGIPGKPNPKPSDINQLTLALDGIRDPGNMGTMIRTADWFGITNIICSADSVDVYNPKVIQATMGSYARVDVHYTDLASFFNSLPKEVPVFGALLEGPDITQKSFVRPGIILIGSESHGISSALLPYVNEPLHIPHFDQKDGNNKAESLNASIANGIICYEICKQLSKIYF